MLLISSNSLFNKDNKQTNKTYLNYLLQNENINSELLCNKNFLPIFNYSCNLMKEIEIEKKDEGLSLMEKLIYSPEYNKFI